MEVIEGALQVETLPDTPQDPSQPPAFQPGPSLLDREAEIKAAIDSAEKKGDDFLNVKVGDLGNTQSPEPKAQEVPEKFKTPTGEVDVEKLKTSTKQLDEAIQKKEADAQVIVDDYVREYREKEAKFRNLPNAEKLETTLRAQTPQPATEAPVPSQMTKEQLEAVINADLARNPAATIADIVDIMVKQKLGQAIRPIEQDLEQVRRDKDDNKLRQNLSALAAKDSRVMDKQVFAAINAKLDSDPDLWKLKNPHKAAWLEVKDEMRLGEPSSAQVQPSRPPSPILGGGTPPPPQSSATGPINHQVLFSALGQANLKDPKQMEAMERAAKEYLDKEFKHGR